MTDTKNEHVKRAIEACGGTGTALASSINRTPQFVSQLLNAERPVPAELCPEIERATKGVVRCEDLRPDVAWDVLRMQSGEESAESATAGAGRE